ncbi:hypothetical protein R3P38DRAFT_3518409 [Favolaschia claudopus]|uniref:Uncharacterized protein n=1 Tax=Favolaschia claudopus TaxID=2862362 RepID=A0AAW0BP34_9AGAR
MLAKLSSLTILDTAIDTPGIPPIPSLKQGVECTTAIRRASSSRPNTLLGQQPTHWHSDSRRRRRERQSPVAPIWVKAQFPTTRHTAADASPSSLSLLYPFGTYPASPSPTRRFRQLIRPHLTSNAPLSARKPRRLTPNSFPHLHLRAPTLRRRTYSRRTFLLPLHAAPFPPSRPSPLSPSPLLYSHPTIPRLSDAATVRNADADTYIISTEKELQAALAAAPTDPNPATPPTPTYSLMPPHARFPAIPPFHPASFHSQLHLQFRPRAPVSAAVSLNTLNDVVGELEIALEIKFDHVEYVDSLSLLLPTSAPSRPTTPTSRRAKTRQRARKQININAPPNLVLGKEIRGKTGGGGRD